MGDTIRRLTATGYSSHRPARARPAVRRRCRPLSSSSSSSSSGSRGGIVLRMITKELRSINLVENSWGMYGRMLMRRAHEADAPKDKRFKHPEWSENAISILSAVREVKGMDDAHPLGCFLCWPSPNGLFLGYDCWHRRVPIDNTTAATQPRQAPLLEPFLYGDPALFCLLPTVRAGYRRTESDNRIRTEKSRAALVDVTRRRPWLSPSPAERGARASGRSAPRD